MLAFFTKAIISSILIWTYKYFDELSIYRKSWNKRYNRNNTFNVQFTRLLSSETKVKEEQSINDSLYKSDDSFIERPNSLEHDEEFKKIFTNLMQRDISEQEFNDLMQYTTFHKEYDSSNIKQNLKKKHNLKHYDIVEKHKKSHIFLKKVDSENESNLFQNSSCNKHHSLKHHDIDKDLLYLRKKRQVYSLVKSNKQFLKKRLLVLFTLIILGIVIALLLYCLPSNQATKSFVDFSFESCRWILL
ncbi:Plasmodium exported protein, unknown function [Plasmodium malariae]|uniref:Pv-fam-d protein n=1 Tax=Plasmodium malariae TaxID=5858 RepID=A0A1D3JLW4_PLAMA|nr:Plasmodium exported protein, unknown function [Plasmodium malariae]SBT87651.1 Plasmodium exported protein, unknown function [Plasmodium malariae]